MMNVLRSSLILCVVLSSTHSKPVEVETPNENLFEPRCFGGDTKKKVDPDAEEWSLKGQANAEKDLEKFAIIAEALKKDQYVDNLLKREMTSLLAQVSEANDNTIEVINSLEGVIDILNQRAGDPGMAGQLVMKASALLMDGKKDNKSYFLLNGAAIWIELRGNKYLAFVNTRGAQALLTDLKVLDVQILTARDTLDTTLKVIYDGLHQLAGLTGNIAANSKQIQMVVGNMKNHMSKNKDVVLKTSQDPVDSIKTIIKRLN